MFDEETLRRMEEDQELNRKLATSWGRYGDRLERFEERRTGIGRRTILPKLTHAVWWFLHNAVSHPIIAIAPIKPAFDFHDYTSDKINGMR